MQTLRFRICIRALIYWWRLGCIYVPLNDASHQADQKIYFFFHPRLSYTLYGIYISKGTSCRKPCSLPLIVYQILSFKCCPKRDRKVNTRSRTVLKQSYISENVKRKKTHQLLHCIFLLFSGTAIANTQSSVSPHTEMISILWINILDKWYQWASEYQMPYLKLRKYVFL